MAYTHHEKEVVPDSTLQHWTHDPYSQQLEVTQAFLNEDSNEIHNNASRIYPSGHVTGEKPTRKICGFRQRTAVIAFVAIIVVIAGVAGGVGGSLGSRKSQSSPTQDASSTSGSVTDSSTVAASTTTKASTTTMMTSNTSSTSPATSSIQPTIITDATGCANGTVYETVDGKSSFSMLCHTDWPAWSSTNANNVVDLVIYDNISNMQTCLELCEAYNKNLTAINSNSDRCTAAVHVFSVNEALAPSGGSKAQQCCIKNRTGNNVTVNYEVVNAAILLTS